VIDDVQAFFFENKVSTKLSTHVAKYQKEEEEAKMAMV
jgi:hypothetical protein